MGKKIMHPMFNKQLLCTVFEHNGQTLHTLRSKMGEKVEGVFWADVYRAKEEVIAAMLNGKSYEDDLLRIDPPFQISPRGEWVVNVEAPVTFNKKHPEAAYFPQGKIKIALSMFSSISENYFNRNRPTPKDGPSYYEGYFGFDLND